MAADLAAAEEFVWRNARLIDRRRYEYLFAGGSAEPVVAALAAYQNEDGGFGHALEPDGRGSASQPAHVHAALAVLDEVGRLRGPMVQRAVDYLGTVTTAAGGVPVALPTIKLAPRAPWWEVGDDVAASLLPTAALVGLLRKNGFEHPWLAGAEQFCWRAVEGLEATHPYEVEACLPFLDHAADRGRAQRAGARLERLVRAQALVAWDADPSGVQPAPGYGPGEVHTPLDYAPRPYTLARAWFSDEQIGRDLDRLAGGQRDDGGWTFNWRAWNDATTLEWRAAVTVRALSTLSAHGRLG